MHACSIIPIFLPSSSPPSNSPPSLAPIYARPSQTRTYTHRHQHTHLDSRLFMAGIATPSPMPMHARAASSTGRLQRAAMGVNTVASDHHTTPNPSTFLPPKRSAHTPPATCARAPGGPGRGRQGGARAQRRRGGWGQRMGRGAPGEPLRCTKPARLAPPPRPLPHSPHCCRPQPAPTCVSR